MAISQTSTTDYLSVGSPAALDNLATATVLMLVYFDSVANDLRYLASKNGAAGWEFHRRAVDGASLRFAILKGGAQSALVGTSTLTTGAWQWIGVSWDCNGTGGLLGNLWRGTGASGPTISDVTSSSTAGSGAQGDDSAETAYFGNYSSVSKAHDGDIAEVLVFNVRVSSTTDVEAMIGGTYGTSPVGVWYPGVTGSALAPDYSGNGNTMTISGGSAIESPRRPVWKYTRALASMGIG